MADNQPTPGQTLAVLLGASVYQHAPKLAQGASFKDSSWEFERYLTDTMRVPQENVESFFNDRRSAPDQLKDVGDFLKRRTAALEQAGTPARDLIIHYVGHGLFSGGDHDYYLAIGSTQEQDEGFTSIRFRDLANAIRNPALFLRKYFILDCCFSAAAVGQLMGGPLSVMEVKVRDVLPDDSPTRGTSFLCSASKEDPALAPKGLKYTMFSDSLLSVLKEGNELYENRISLSDLGDLVRKRINATHRDDGVRPEVHSPDKRWGDVARLRFFPNPKASPAPPARATPPLPPTAPAPPGPSARATPAAPPTAPAPPAPIKIVRGPSDLKGMKQRGRMIRLAMIIAIAFIAIYAWSFYQKKTQDELDRIRRSRPVWQSREVGTKRLHSVFGSQDGWHLWAVGDKGTILQSDDGGVTWQARTAKPARKQNSIFGTQNLSHLWTVGEKGAILQSDDYGATWQVRMSGTTDELRSVFGAPDGTRLWTVGEKGTILQSDDEGATWETRMSGTPDNLNSVFGARDGKHIWAVGDHGVILQSDDLGATWQARSSGTTEKLKSIFSAMPGAPLWVVGEKGIILKSDDNSATWNARMTGTAGALNSIRGTADGSRLWVVGDNGTVLQSDAGFVMWREEFRRDAVAPEFTGYTPPSKDLLSIFGTQDGKHLCAVGDSGTVLRFGPPDQ